MVDIDGKIKEGFANLPVKDKDILIVRLLIMLKLNEIVFYQNCKNCIFDSRGKHVMEYLVEEQKKHIEKLEIFAPTLPNELKIKFSGISHFLLSYGNGNSQNFPKASSPSGVQNEDSTEKLIDNDTIRLTANEEASNSDINYLVSAMQKKGDFRKINLKLLECLDDNSCGQLFHEILEDELRQQEMLAHNYNNLSNTGRWSEQFPIDTA
jgi:rubrerythrin